MKIQTINLLLLRVNLMFELLINDSSYYFEISKKKIIQSFNF